jgi:hypothetical protein
MSEPNDPNQRSSLKHATEVARSLFKAALVLAGIGFLLYVVNVQIPRMSEQFEDTMPGLVRDFLLWFATDKTVAQINSFAAEWSGLLTLLGIGLAVIFYVLSLPDRSKTKGDKG